MPHCDTALVPSAWNGEYDLTLIYVGSSAVDKHWVPGSYMFLAWPCKWSGQTQVFSSVTSRYLRDIPQATVKWPVH